MELLIELHNKRLAARRLSTPNRKDISVLPHLMDSLGCLDLCENLKIVLLTLAGKADDRGFITADDAMTSLAGLAIATEAATLTTDSIATDATDTTTKIIKTIHTQAADASLSQVRLGVKEIEHALSELVKKGRLAALTMSIGAPYSYVIVLDDLPAAPETKGGAR